MLGWRNWYTRNLEVVVPVRACRFKSCPEHISEYEAGEQRIDVVVVKQICKIIQDKELKFFIK